MYNVVSLNLCNFLLMRGLKSLKFQPLTPQKLKLSDISGLLDAQQGWPVSVSPGPCNALVPSSQPPAPASPDSTDYSIAPSSESAKPPLIATAPLVASTPSLMPAQSLAAYGYGGGLQATGGLAAGTFPGAAALSSAGLSYATGGLTAGNYAAAGLAAGNYAAGGLTAANYAAGGLTAANYGSLAAGGLQSGLAASLQQSGLVSAYPGFDTSGGQYVTYTASPTGGVKLVQNPYSLGSGGLMSNPLNAAAGLSHSSLAGNPALGANHLTAASFGTGFSASPLSLARLHGGAVGIPMAPGLGSGGSAAARGARVYKGTESGIFNIFSIGDLALQREFRK